MKTIFRRAILIVTLLMTISTVCPVYAGNGTVSNMGTVVLRRTSNNNSSKPRVPNGQIVECEMRDNLLVLDFAFAEGISTITITAVPEGTDYTYWFDSSALPISFAVPPSDVLQIEVHTDWGNTYEGILELE